MSLIDFVNSSIAKYGQNGDRSFEYVGILIRNATVCDKRIYRKSCESVTNLIQDKEPFKLTINKTLKKFIGCTGVQLCDVSFDESNGEIISRIVYKIPGNLSHLQLQMYVNNFFCDFTDFSYKSRVIANIRSFIDMNVGANTPLIQIGVEINKHGEIIGIKYYLQFAKQKYLKENIDQALLYTNFISNNSFVKQISSICVNNYEPVFVGINDRGGIEEQKIYFRSRAFGHQTHNILMNSNNLHDVLGWKEALSKSDIQNLWDRNLFIEGIALSLQNKDEWRIYINALPRKKI